MNRHGEILKLARHHTPRDRRLSNGAQKKPPGLVNAQPLSLVRTSQANKMAWLKGGKRDEVF